MDHLSFLKAQQLFKKLSIENRRTYEVLLLGLLLANVNFAPCVNGCRPVFLFARILGLKPVVSQIVKTRPVPSNIRSCLSFSGQDQIVKFKIYYKTGKQKKIYSYSVDGICFHCNTVFEALVCFYHFCPCQAIHPSITDEGNQRGVKKREFDELRPNWIQKAASVSWKFGIMSSGDCTRQPIRLNYMSDKFSLIDVQLQNTNPRE